VQAAVGFILGALAHHASIQNNDIGLIGPLAGLVPQALQGRRQAQRVGHIHLTTFSPNVIFHVQYYNKFS
jgi:hypothetical protein